MDEKVFKAMSLLIFLLMVIVFFMSRSEAQECVVPTCEDAFVDVGEPICNEYGCFQTLEDDCLYDWLWMYPEDGTPEYVVTTVGSFWIVDDMGSCEPPLSHEYEEPLFSDHRLDWHSFVGAVYSAENGAEVYCVDKLGNGTLALALDEYTPSGVDFGCGVFYILETGEYQLSLIDGVTLVADNLWFVNSYQPME